MLEKQNLAGIVAHAYNVALGRLRQCVVASRLRGLCIQSLSQKRKRKLKQNPGREACLTAASLACLSPCRDRWFSPLSTVALSQAILQLENSGHGSQWLWMHSQWLWMNSQLWTRPTASILAGEPKTQLALAFSLCDTDCIWLWEMTFLFYFTM